MSISYLREPEYLAPLDESVDGNDFSVLIDRKTVKAIAKRICDKLHHPVTILDMNRLGIHSDIKNKFIIKIDSDIEYFALHDACKLLRYYAGANQCHECDSFHAVLLKGIKRDTKKEELEARIENSLENYPAYFVSSYRTEKGKPKIIEILQKESSTHRLVIEYHCPMLGYRESLFPIFFKDNVVGILVVRQAVINETDDKETIRMIQEDFLRNKEVELKEKIIKAYKYNEEMERCLKQPKEGGDIHLSTMTFNSFEDYINFIRNVCEVLKDEENNLEKGAKIKREKYFSTIVNKAVNEYFKNKTNSTPNENTYEYLQEYLKSAWERFYLAKETIMKMLHLEDMILFGDTERINAVGNMKRGIYTNNPYDRKNHAKWSYDFSKLTDKKPLMYEPLISLDDDSILNGLYPTIDKTNVILLVYADVVIYLKVKDLEKHKRHYLVMANSISKGFSRIYADIALHSANLMKERYMLTLRTYRHESAHISARLNDNFEAYFVPDASKFKMLTKEKQDHITQDMRDAISLISHMSSNIGIITGSINVDKMQNGKGRVDVISLLYKWQVMFRDRLYGKNLDMMVQKDFIIDAPRSIKTNLDLFELLLYNLVDNAVKYAYRGSVIRLGWRYLPVDNWYFELSVSSYGPQMELGDRLYELYTRGSIHTGNREGDGMGLYVIRRICAILGLGGVSHTSEYISKYNIPLISWYLREPFEDSVHNVKKDELTDFLKNISSNDERNIRAVINNNENTKIIREDLTRKYLAARIDRGTYLTTFTVKVPVDMKYPLQTN